MTFSMRSFPRAGLAVLLALLTTTAGSPASGTVRSPASRPGIPPVAAALAGYQVTLLTGDKVTVEDLGGTPAGIFFTPARGRAGIPFHISTVRAADGHRDAVEITTIRAFAVAAG